MEGLFYSANSKTFLTISSASSGFLFIISEPLIKNMYAPISIANALTINVFPDPDTPDINNPFIV